MNYKDYIANENQLYGVREFRLDNDLHQKLLYVYNASGLTLIVNQSRNCDISEVKVRGNNISYLSSVDYDFPNKETHPSHFLSSFLGVLEANQLIMGKITIYMVIFQNFLLENLTFLLLKKKSLLKVKHMKRQL